MGHVTNKLYHNKVVLTAKIRYFYLSVACGIVLLYAPLEYIVSYHIIYLHFSQGYQWIKCSLGYGVDFVVRQDSIKKNTCLYI